MSQSDSDLYARMYLCPDPDEHGEIVFVVGRMLAPSMRRSTAARWERIDAVPDCPICGSQMVHDTDDRPLLLSRESSTVT